MIEIVGEPPPRARGARSTPGSAMVILSGGRANASVSVSRVVRLETMT